MALNLDSKKAVVEEVAVYAAKAFSAVAAEYRGLTVTELTELRKTARETGVYLRVVKNTLAKRAVAGTDFECMQSGLIGPLLLAFSMEDPGSAGRLIHNFAKTQREYGRDYASYPHYRATRRCFPARVSARVWR